MLLYPKKVKQQYLFVKQLRYMGHGIPSNTVTVCNLRSLISYHKSKLLEAGFLLLKGVI